MFGISVWNTVLQSTVALALLAALPVVLPGVFALAIVVSLFGFAVAPVVIPLLICLGFLRDGIQFVKDGYYHLADRFWRKKPSAEPGPRHVAVEPGAGVRGWRGAKVKPYNVAPRGPPRGRLAEVDGALLPPVEVVGDSGWMRLLPAPPAGRQLYTGTLPLGGLPGLADDKARVVHITVAAPSQAPGKGEAAPAPAPAAAGCGALAGAPVPSAGAGAVAREVETTAIVPSSAPSPAAAAATTAPAVAPPPTPTLMPAPALAGTPVPALAEAAGAAVTAESAPLGGLKGPPEVEKKTIREIPVSPPAVKQEPPPKKAATGAEGMNWLEAEKQAENRLWPEVKELEARVVGGKPLIKKGSLVDEVEQLAAIVGIPAPPPSKGHGLKEAESMIHDLKNVIIGAH